ncbi:hypothetical protein [Streptosporangium sp. NPDC048865]|uniref:hypothetical protein n=1 Tax=Streptosporangium sp. NPDC048865 TaxID=3155766 RepID=UPI00341A242E
MSVMPPHVLVVGGTGILSPAVRVLVDRGARVSVVSRSGHGVPAGADAVVADVTRVAALAAALDLAIGERGPLRLALAYQPFAPAGAWAALAARVGGPLVALLTSGHAAPLDAPAPPLPAGAAVGAEGAVGAEVRHLLLGWHPAGAGLPARWHTPEEISAAALEVAGVTGGDDGDDGDDGNDGNDGNDGDIAAPAGGSGTPEGPAVLGVVRPWDGRPGG